MAPAQLFRMRRPRWPEARAATSALPVITVGGRAGRVRPGASRMVAPMSGLQSLPACGAGAVPLPPRCGGHGRAARALAGRLCVRPGDLRRAARRLRPARSRPSATARSRTRRPTCRACPTPSPRIEPIRAGGPEQAVRGVRPRYVPITADRPFTERGLASWYGRKFHGRPTASGETYNMYAMTAAHPTLPIPSYVRVRNPANGREVIVRVNDRGPFHAAASST